MNGRDVVMKQQSCKCGSTEYGLYLLVIAGKTHKAAACSECGRITGSVGGGQLRGENIRDYGQ